MFNKNRAGIISAAIALVLVAGCGDIGELGLTKDDKDAVESGIFEPVGAEKKASDTDEDSNGASGPDLENEATDYSEEETKSDVSDREEVAASDNESENKAEDNTTGATEDADSNDLDPEQITEALENNISEEELAEAKEAGEKGILNSTADINLRDLDGNGSNYAFTYDGTDYSAVYTTDNWRVEDSYKINNIADITIICQALIDVHPIHGRDMQSYREASDLAFEWLQHNLAYAALSDDNSLKSHAKDVDLDPADQGRSFEEMYEDRTGKELDINDFISEEDQEKLFEALKDVINGQ
ncbi:hypothetical protein [Butyrivibrio sp. WCE2006]|uniref:hypothetical protein n=1 Tax=Butyrivibrio sp. WCE2006 TaxID=1410611 RepID=UPI0005D17892|nr:hypothetical protein [Butyrivibrio sp. WCE2006]